MQWGSAFRRKDQQLSLGRAVIEETLRHLKWACQVGSWICDVRVLERGQGSTSEFTSYQDT